MTWNCWNTADNVLITGKPSACPEMPCYIGGFMRTTTADVEICCPHCETEDTYLDVTATACVENTCVGWTVADGVNELTCDECGKKFKATAHLDVKVAKI